MNIDKQEQEAKKDIAKRLRHSNKVRWDSLSKEEKDRAVDRYYDLGSIENIGIHKALEDNRNVRRELGAILIGLVLGLFGNFASDVLLKYLPRSIGSDIFSLVAFGILLGVFIYMIDWISVDRLKRDNVLEHLLKDSK